MAVEIKSITVDDKQGRGQPLSGQPPAAPHAVPDQTQGEGMSNIPTTLDNVP